MTRERWHEIPGVFAMVIVLTPVAVLCILATIFRWW